MKEIPILMSTEMVQATLEGRKTKTRRVLKPQPEIGVDKSPERQKLVNFLEGTDKVISTFWKNCNYANWPEGAINWCPYGRVGDLLWVRETWLYNDSISEPYAYKADYNEEHQQRMKGFWKPSIFLPKVAARIWLEVRDVKVERLQDTAKKMQLQKAFKKIFVIIQMIVHPGFTQRRKNVVERGNISIMLELISILARMP